MIYIAHVINVADCMKIHTAFVPPTKWQSILAGKEVIWRWT